MANLKTKEIGATETQLQVSEWIQKRILNESVSPALRGNVPCGDCKCIWGEISGDIENQLDLTDLINRHDYTYYGTSYTLPFNAVIDEIINAEISSLSKIAGKHIEPLVNDSVYGVDASGNTYEGIITNIENDQVAFKIISINAVAGSIWGTVKGDIENQRDLINTFYTKDNVNNLLDNKADKLTTYTKTEVNTLITDTVQHIDASITNVNAEKADKSDTYTKDEVNIIVETLETSVENDLNLKSDKSDTYTKTEVDDYLDLKSDKSNTYTKDEVDDYLNLKSDNATVVAAGNEFDLFDAPMFTLTDDGFIDIDYGATVEFDYDEWVEYSYYDTVTGTSYLTLVEWEQQANNDDYILTLRTADTAHPLIIYNKPTDTYTVLETRNEIELGHKLGIKAGGSHSSKLDGFLSGRPASDTALTFNLSQIYGLTRAVDYSTDNSIKLIFEQLDKHTQQLFNTYNSTEIDAKLTALKTYTDDSFQPLNEKDYTIPLDPLTGHYPTTEAVKSYVDTQVSEYSNSHYRGFINYCSKSGVADGDPAPSGSIEGDTLIDISNDKFFRVTNIATLQEQPPVEADDGYYYDIYHFAWNTSQSGQIKYSTYMGGGVEVPYIK